MRLTGDNKTDLLVLITVTVGACFVVWLLLSSSHPLRGGCVSLKLVQSARWSGRYFDPSSSGLESAAQPGSAAKAVCSMERLCPILSMAPALAIVYMVAVLS